jgi:hypothetical protein
MRRHLKYLSYVLRHKWFVFLACIPLGVPILSAIFHDWDKFLPGGWFPYARCFYAPNGAKQYIETPAFNYAWNAHQKRNKHHYQYWVILWDSGGTECLAMPDVHRREMLADWRGAGRALGFPDTLAWYSNNRDNIKLHDDTRIWVEKQLGYKVTL